MINEKWQNSLRNESYSNNENRLTSIDLHDNYLTDVTAKLLTKLLKEDTTVKSINFSKNSITRVGIKSFINLLQSNKNIQFLDISDNLGIGNCNIFISHYNVEEFKKEFMLFGSITNGLYINKKKKKKKKMYQIIFDDNISVSSQVSCTGRIENIGKQSKIVDYLKDENEKLKSRIRELEKIIMMNSFNDTILNQLESTMKSITQKVSNFLGNEEKNKELNTESNAKSNLKPETNIELNTKSNIKSETEPIMELNTKSDTESNTKIVNRLNEIFI